MHLTFHDFPYVKHYFILSLCVISLSFYVELPPSFSRCYYTHASCVYACFCFCYALHHCSKIDFLRLSHHTVRAGSRKCLLPWRSVNVMLWQTLLSDTWQGALSGPPCECADARACVRVCAGFPASLMRCFLRLFVFSQMGGWLCRAGSWEISFRGRWTLIKFSHWPACPTQTFLKPLQTSTSTNIIPAIKKN